ncbi:unnamed protein product, partial [Rotaria magnacalcarata]
PSITVDNRVTQRVSYEKYKRIGIRNGGIYFPTVQFELRIDPNQLANEQARNAVQHLLWKNKLKSRSSNRFAVYSKITKSYNEIFLANAFEYWLSFTSSNRSSIPS